MATRRSVSTVTSPLSPCDHLPEDLPADGFVGHRGFAPPPAILLHLAGGGDKSVGDLSEIGVGVVQAEDETAGADPAQRDPLRPQIILKHPVVARRLGIMNHPDRRQIRDPHGQPLRGQPVVQLLRAPVPGRIEAVVDRPECRIREARQELIHRNHDVGMRIEGAAGKAHVDRAVVPEAAHQVFASADRADRQAAGQRLAVGDHVGANSEILLGAAGGEPEADKDLVEDQDNAALGANFAQRFQPGRVGRAIEGRLARTVDQRGIRGRIDVGMQRLQRVDQDTGDVAPGSQHLQRALGHVGERVGLVRRDRIAHARLHIAPPAMIRACETDQMRASGVVAVSYTHLDVYKRQVVARKPHRLHHGLGAGHVERDFVEPGDGAQPRDVFGNDGMVGAEHGTERSGTRLGPRDAVLVEVVAEDIDAVRPGQVVEGIAVDVGHRDAARCLHENAGAEVLANQPAVLERHPVGCGELQIRDPLGRLRGHLPVAGEPFAKDLRQPEKTVPAPIGHLGRRPVGPEEIVAAEFVERDQARDAARHFRVPGQRAMLRPRQHDPGSQFGEGRYRENDRDRRAGKNHRVRIHGQQRYSAPLTES